MYDYRRMTEEEKRVVVQQRCRRGFPLHKPPHMDLGAGWYFISAATFEHQSFFNSPSELTALTTRLLEGFQQKDIPVAGWVVMPNHYHILVCVDHLQQVGSVVGQVHGHSSRYANLRDNQTGRKVWYKYSDRKIRSERHYCTGLHYMISNPVKHRFSREISNWPWSCYNELIEKQGQQWIDNLRNDYPLLEFGKGWDD